MYRSHIFTTCVRHKSFDISYNGNRMSKGRYKLVRVKKSNSLLYPAEDPTSNTNAYHQNKEQNGENIVAGRKFSEIVPCISPPLLRETKIVDITQKLQVPQKNDNMQTNNTATATTNIVAGKSMKSEKLTVEKEEVKEHSDSQTRINEINIQMLSKTLYEQLFKNVPEKEKVSLEEVKSIKENLEKYGIDTKTASKLPDVDIKLPPLEGSNIEEHFYNIATEQVSPYLNIIEKILKDVPAMPKHWLLKEGWVRYTANDVVSVDYPLENGIVFDVEVCVKDSPLPILATAVTEKAWYGWVSKRLRNDSKGLIDNEKFSTDMLIPMESKSTENGEKLSNFQERPKIIVGHNVSYDRSRIKEQYWLNSTKTRFIDTMSLHISVSGINSYQRSLLNSKKINIKDEDWLSCTSMNNLMDVHKLYCGTTISKDARNIFTEGTLRDIKRNFNSLMTYCATDVVATHNILRNLFPLFRERFSHPVTLAGMLELGTAYLPVNSNWQRYLKNAESTFEDLNYEGKFFLAKRADAVCSLMHNEKYKEDLWMWDQDWSTQEVKFKKVQSKPKIKRKVNNLKELENALHSKNDLAAKNSENSFKGKIEKLKESRTLIPSKVPHMNGYPAWYRKLCPKTYDKTMMLDATNISSSMQVVPKLLNLTWENYPLHYIRGKGWGILVPYNNSPNIETTLPLKQLLIHCPPPASSNIDCQDDQISTICENVQNNLQREQFWRFQKKTGPDISRIYNGTAVWCDENIDNCCYFLKLPHKDGSDRNVGNPLSKDFLNKFSENVLASVDTNAMRVLELAKMVSYWRNNRDRIRSQLVIWFDDSHLPDDIHRDGRNLRYGAIVPQVVVSGTLTRRAVEPTWMTASNAHAERVGSELRAMIQAPAGYNIVGADVDSQELWIASIIGDAYYKQIHGASPFGWMTVIGNKANKTDMHSVTAKAVGISRDHAKIINYARIYGAGQRFAERLLKQYNPSMTGAEAAAKSRKMFALTKGKKVYRLKPKYVNEDIHDKLYPVSAAYSIAKLNGKSVSEMFMNYKWIDGSESAMFNRLEEIAGSVSPVTPFLGSKLSRALEGEKNNSKFLPTKVNWVVQSGAVDFLHLMLVSMRWLMKDNARFSLSFHDEVRYLVRSEYKYNAALAMHVTNLLTRSFCSSRLGMYDLPMSVAFFTSVEVDTALRKESSQDCKTPSNSHGLQGTYNIPPGESLDIWTTIEKSGGSLGSWHSVKP